MAIIPQNDIPAERAFLLCIYTVELDAPTFEFRPLRCRVDDFVTFKRHF
jgi:hypothetical protein